MALVAYSLLVSVGACVVTAKLLLTYPRRPTPPLVLVLVATSLFSVFELVGLLPADYASETDDESGHNALRMVFAIIYWFTYVLMWAVLPIVQEYYNAGDFTRWKKLKTSLKLNGLFFLAFGILVAAFLIYLYFKRDLHGESLVGFCIALGNVWGLTLLVVTLGYGLVEIPRKVWYAGNAQVRLDYLYYKTSVVHDDLELAKESFSNTIKMVEIAREHVDENVRDPLSHCLDIIQEKLEEYSDLDRTVSEHFPVEATHSKLRDKLKSGDITEGNLAQLHAKTMTSGRELRRLTRQWNRCLVDIEDAEIALEYAQQESAPAGIGGTWANMMWHFNHRYKRKLVKASAVVLMIFSTMLVWSEATLPADLSIFALISEAITDAPLDQFFGLLVISYMSLCSFFAVFRLKILTYYHLHNRHGTDASSLIMAATIMLRIVISICFNFLEVMKVDTTHSAFEDFTGKLDLVPVLGKAFNLYVPIAISIVSALVLFNVFGRIMSTLKFTRFDFGRQTADSEELVLEGKRIYKRAKRRLARQDRGVHTNGRKSGQTLEFIRLDK